MNRMINLVFKDNSIAINPHAIELIHYNDKTHQIEIYFIGNDKGVLVLHGDRDQVISVYKKLVVHAAEIDASNLSYAWGEI